MPKYHDCLRVIEYLPEALAECAGAAEAAAELLQDLTEKEAELAYYTLQLLHRRLRQIEEFFEPGVVTKRLEDDEYRRIHFGAREMSHEI